ncbi:hypothetical protein BC829DRAFT_406389, partial [Chytridium lagenaria]
TTNQMEDYDVDNMVGTFDLPQELVGPAMAQRSTPTKTVAVSSPSQPVQVPSNQLDPGTQEAMKLWTSVYPIYLGGQAELAACIPLKWKQAMEKGGPHGKATGSSSIQIRDGRKAVEESYKDATRRLKAKDQAATGKEEQEEEVKGNHVKHWLGSVDAGKNIDED